MHRFAKAQITMQNEAALSGHRDINERYICHLADHSLRFLRCYLHSPSLFAHSVMRSFWSTPTWVDLFITLISACAPTDFPLVSPPRRLFGYFLWFNRMRVSEDLYRSLRTFFADKLCNSLILRTSLEIWEKRHARSSWASNAAFGEACRLRHSRPYVGQQAPHSAEQMPCFAHQERKWLRRVSSGAFRERRPDALIRLRTEFLGQQRPQRFYDLPRGREINLRPFAARARFDQASLS